MREIITNSEMRAIDAACPAAGVPTRTLMENAGRAVADAVAAHFTARSVAVLCGPGNNGGDGWVAARLLKQRGWDVWVETLVDPASLGGDAANAAAQWDGETLRIGQDNPVPDLFVDALFGAGLTRPLEGEALRLARSLSTTPERVVAVDVPSGLDGDSGKPLGDACFSAALTVTFVRKKPAHVLLPGRDHCGEVVVADIGAPHAAIDAQRVRLWENDPALWSAQWPWPQTQAHKHARGHAMIASGGHARSGAARLAAHGALRIGAGLVTVLSPRDALAENAAQLTAIMLREAEGAAFAEAAVSAQALLIGPGFGLEDKNRQALDAARNARGRCPLVLDADALTLLAPLKNQALYASDVITPHVGEFKRAFPNVLDTTPSRIEAARLASEHAGCVVLLKGPDTVIAAPDGRAIVNSTGSPFLATAGSGDVLAGMIAGLIAQGMASFEAAVAAAWLHGRAGEMLGAGLVSEDLPQALPQLLDELAPPALKARWPS